MARVTVDDCLDHVPNRFQMTLAATYRARQITAGASPMVEANRDIRLPNRFVLKSVGAKNYLTTYEITGANLKALLEHPFINGAEINALYACTGNTFAHRLALRQVGKPLLHHRLRKFLEDTLGDATANDVLAGFLGDLPLACVGPLADSPRCAASDSGFRINHAEHLSDLAATRTQRSTDDTRPGSIASSRARINALLGQVVHGLTRHHCAFA